MIPNLKAKFISCRGIHTGIIDFQNNIWMCGYNIDGRLGLGDYTNRNILTIIANMKAKFITCSNVTTGIIRIKF